MNMWFENSKCHTSRQYSIFGTSLRSRRLSLPCAAKTSVELSTKLLYSRVQNSRLTVSTNCIAQDGDILRNDVSVVWKVQIA